MPGTSLNMTQLSRYLHLPEKQVQKMVDRGTIPGRKIQGEWFFSKDEVHRWLEVRIGASDDAELADVEGALARSATADEETEVRISKLLHAEAIQIPLKGKTRDSVIRTMSGLAAETGLLWDADAMTEAIKTREELHPTALDNGVALLHPRRPMSSILGDSFIAMGITPTGIPFGGGFGNLTDVFFLICSTDDRVHLRTLARLSRILTYPDFLDKLRGASNPDQVIELVRETEEAIR